MSSAVASIASAAAAAGKTAPPSNGSGGQVFVAVRVRPRIDGSAISSVHGSERYHQQACQPVGDTMLRLTDGLESRESRSYTFTFDRVFNEDVSQDEVYEETAVDAIDTVLIGNNATVLTYGQTGSGKTYTMLGEVKGKADRTTPSDVITSDTGIFLRAVQDILSYGERRHRELGMTICLSVLEIYLDEVRDLLNVQGNGRGTPVSISIVKDVVRTPGVQYVEIRNIDDAVRVFQRTSACRMQRATSANETSSRSHAMFVLDVFQYPVSAARTPKLQELLAMRDAAQLASVDAAASSPSGSPTTTNPAGITCKAFPNPNARIIGSTAAPVMYSKLSLVDLAGSEKARNSNVSGTGFDELRRINFSLTALGNVIHSLFEGSKHIPYRDTKLTVMLRESFSSPSSRIALIANVSPTTLTLDESLSSLYFADKVKALKTRNNNLIGAEEKNAARREQAYLASLRSFEALTADLRIASVQFETPIPAVRTVLAKHETAASCCPLTNRTLSVPLKVSSDARSKALRTLCAALKAVDIQGIRRQRQEEMLEGKRKAMVSELVAKAGKKRQSVLDELRHMQTVEEPQLTEDFEDAVRRWKAAIGNVERGTAIAAQKTMALRAERLKAFDKRDASDSRLRALDAQLAEILADADTNELAVLKKNISVEHDAALAQDRNWRATTESVEEMLECLSRRTAYISARHEVFLAGEELRRSKTLVEPDPDYAWMREIVESMATFAVGESIERRGIASTCRFDLERIITEFALEKSSNHGSVADLQSTARSSTDAQSTTEKSSSSKAVSPATGAGCPKPTATSGPAHYAQRQRQRESNTGSRKLSLYDDPNLVSDIMAYMQLGAKVSKMSRSGGAPQKRLIFVTHNPSDRVSPYRLCWDSAASLDRGSPSKSYVPLSLVRKIELGQCTENLRKHGDKSLYYSSFSLTYATSAREKSSLRTIDLVCSTVPEMEAWVIGIASITKVYPVFGELMSESVVNTASGLSERELQVCRQWHIPVAVLCESRQQIEKRVAKREPPAPLRVSPGELSQLSRLDIFRASALWLFFHKENLLENSKKRLSCFVLHDEEGEEMHTNTTAGVSAVTDTSDSGRSNSRSRSRSTAAATTLTLATTTTTTTNTATTAKSDRRVESSSPM